MAYDTALAARVRAAASSLRGVTEKQMFGGLAFLLEGKMFVGVLGSELMVRVGPDRHDEALAVPYVRTMDFTGRPMRGYVFVAPVGLEGEAEIRRWVRWSSDFVSGLPAKATPRPAGRGRAAPTKARAKAGGRLSAKGRRAAGARPR